MQFKKLAFLTILTLLFFTGCGDSKVSEEKSEPIKKQRNYQLSNIDGNKINILAKDEKLFFEEYKGKVVLVNFFATWCPPCKAEIPTLNNIKQKFEQDFEVVAVSLAQRNGKLATNEKIVQFVKDFNIIYPIVNSPENYALAKEMGGVKSIPTMFLISKEGKIIQKYVGIVPEEMLETDIKKALGK